MRSELSVCKICRRPFFVDSMTGKTLCRDCKQRLEDELPKVKDYLWSHPGSEIGTIAEETGVSTDQIYDWLREGRLELAPESPIVLKCSRCKNPIMSGMLCDACSEQLQKVIVDLAREMGDPTITKETFMVRKDLRSVRMRFFEH